MSLVTALDPPRADQLAGVLAAEGWELTRDSYGVRALRHSNGAVARINRTGSGLVFPAGRPWMAIAWSASSPLDVVTVLLDQIASAP